MQIISKKIKKTKKIEEFELSYLKEGLVIGDYTD
jgi:hypothetical protein